MPFTRRRTYGRRRRFGKSRRFRRKFISHKKFRSRATMKSMRSPLVVTDRLRVKLAYNTFFSYSAGAGTSYSQIFQSSAFDPDMTGVGQQPLGYDEWCGFYNKYRVLGIKWDFSIVSTNSTAITSFSVFPTLSPSAPSSVPSVMSLPYSKTRTLGISSGPSRCRIKGFMSTRKIYGLKSVSQEDDFAANYNASPVNLWYVQLYANALSAAPSGAIDGRLTYYVEFFDRRQLEIS